MAMQPLSTDLSSISIQCCCQTGSSYPVTPIS